MFKKTTPVVLLCALCLLISPAGPVALQQYQPTVGQAGRDVIWVPTPEDVVEAMLDMAKVTGADCVIDLGSGDGRVVIAAAKRGARAIGYEYEPEMVELSRQSAAKEGVADRASFVCADIFETDFSQATVLTMYLLQHLNVRLRPKILEMKPGTRVVSHAFTMEDWEADQTTRPEGRTAYLWIVPSKVEGTWTCSLGTANAELTLKQAFQKIEGILRTGGVEMPISEGKVEGDRISFSVIDSPVNTLTFSGRINGNMIEGNAKANNNQSPAKWLAERGAFQAVR